jgi:hypothetical protein
MKLKFCFEWSIRSNRKSLLGITKLNSALKASLKKKNSVKCPSWPANIDIKLRTKMNKNFNSWPLKIYTPFGLRTNL